jgi:DNA-binding GntR family transcriptional regulator
MDRTAAAADFAAFYPLNVQFHDVIVEATGNNRLIKMYRGLVKEFHLFRTHGLVQQGALITSNKEHRTIVKALEKHDSAECYRVSFQHVANGKQRMLTALDNLAASGDVQTGRDSEPPDYRSAPASLKK